MSATTSLYRVVAHFLFVSSRHSFAFQAGDGGSILELGRPPGEGNGYPLQYSCLGNPMERGAWWATVHGVIKGRTWLSIHMCTHAGILLC